MAYTISLRMDSAAAQKHNTRELLTRELEHPERTVDNITLLHIDCREAYQTIFAKPIEDYNSRQKRSDRKIKYDGRGYYDKLLNQSFNKATKRGNKEGHQHPYYETIIQIGDKDNHPDEQTSIQCLTDYFNHWKDQNKNLFVVGAYIHLDESTPHLHIDYVPVARMKKGMKLQNGLNKAFEQLMGYESKNVYDTAQQQFQSREREVLRSICRERGLDIEETKHNDRKHLTVKQYKEQKIADEMDIIRALETVEVSDKGKQSIFQRLTGSEYTTVRKTDLAVLQEQARQNQGKDQLIKELQERYKDIKAENNKFKQGISKDQQAIRSKKQELNGKITTFNQTVDQFEKIRSGEEYQKKKQEILDLKEEYLELRSDIRQSRKELENTKEELTGLKKMKQEVEQWLADHLQLMYERMFCQRHLEEYEEFEQEQRQQSRGRSR